MLPLIVKIGIGLGAATLGFVGYEVAFAKKGVLTAERKLIFDTAMRECSDPAKLRSLASTFDKWGLPAQATQLRTRAATLEQPPSVQQARQQAANQAAATTDPQKAPAVQNVANAFASTGDPATAAALTTHAQQLAAQGNGVSIYDLPDDNPLSPYYQKWLASQQPQGTEPIAKPGVALGDNLGAVKTVLGEKPAGGGDARQADNVTPNAGDNA